MQSKHLVATLFTVFLAQACGSSFADDDDYSFWQRKPGVAPVNNSTYKTECGSCHFAYQPGLLPAKSWNKIMSTLDKHFGDNAELDTAVKTQIQTYLQENSADKSNFRRSKNIMRYMNNEEAPLRITETRYIRGKHDEIPQRLIAGNDKVGHLSRCDACHQNVDSGSFSENQIKIPGYGRWDD